jgi:hypothetical protein
MDTLFRLFAVLLLFLATGRQAAAYLDPISGSLIIQGLIALVAGIVAGVKSIRRRIIKFVTGLLRRKDA